MVHTPVLLEETLFFLDVRPGARFIDATADGGGHAIAILDRIRPSGKLLAIEWDEELFERLRERLAKICMPTSKSCVLRRGSYTDLYRFARSSSCIPAAGVLFDFGMSSFQLEASSRGFSFQKSEPLDMRMSRELAESAADVLARRSAVELEAILRDLGEEPCARRIASAISAARRTHPIRRTNDLVAIIRQAVPVWYRRRRIHFATRTFQALRIAVNRELENIPRGLAAACRILAPGGRIVAISYHSLEDRLVKQFFRNEGVRSVFRTLTPKPVRPSRREVLGNPRARSARLRAFERIP